MEPVSVCVCVVVKQSEEAFQLHYFALAGNGQRDVPHLFGEYDPTCETRSSSSEEITCKRPSAAKNRRKKPESVDEDIYIVSRFPKKKKAQKETHCTEKAPIDLSLSRNCESCSLETVKDIAKWR